jgi:hypothetical protein
MPLFLNITNACYKNTEEIHGRQVRQAVILMLLSVKSHLVLLRFNGLVTQNVSGGNKGQE